MSKGNEKQKPAAAVESKEISTEVEASKGLSRRNFIKGTALGAAGLVVGGGLLNSCVSSPAAGTDKKAAETWDYEADVVILGAGATGLPAALRAMDAGASVLILEQNYDVGGRAITSGGATPLGGGTRVQKLNGIEDSPDKHFKDMTDWTVLTKAGIPEFRYNNPAMMRASCDVQPKVFDYLENNGVRFADDQLMALAGRGGGWGVSVPRNNMPIDDLWDKDAKYSPALAAGAALVRPLERTVRARGAKIMLNRHADRLIREGQFEGRVLGVEASYSPRILPGTNTRLESYYSEGNIDERREKIRIRARKAVIIATSGITGNKVFRKMYDNRSDDSMIVSNQPYDGIGRSQDGTMIIEAMDHGAILGSVVQMLEHGGATRKRNVVGCEYVYTQFPVESPVFPFARATGLVASGAVYRESIVVNQAGKRFYDETGAGYAYPRSGPTLIGNTVNKPYVPGDWRNTLIPGGYAPVAYTDASRALNEGSTFPEYYRGPTWMILDSNIVRRAGWKLGEPFTDPKFFFEASTLAELAQKIRDNPYQKVPMPAENLIQTVERYNSFVASGTDSDFGKTRLQHKIETPPFYAAWCTCVYHDSYGTLEVNEHCQVQDRWGKVIPGLYAGGEAAGGWSEHGLGRCVVQGYIAGDHAARS